MQPRERLNEMLVRSEKATKGPWEAMDYSDPRYATGYPGVGSHAAETYILQPGFTSDSDTNFIAAARTDLPALAKCLLAAIGPLERCRDKLIELRDSERMLGASAYERALIQYRIDEANEALDIINRELGE